MLPGKDLRLSKILSKSEVYMLFKRINRTETYSMKISIESLRISLAATGGVFPVTTGSHVLAPR